MEPNTDAYTFDLQYLFECYPIRKRLLKRLMTRDLFVLQFVVRDVSKQPCNNTNLMESWAGAGYLNVMKWAHLNGCPLFRNSYVRAARIGRIDMLEWLHDKRV